MGKTHNKKLIIIKWPHKRHSQINFNLILCNFFIYLRNSRGTQTKNLHRIKLMEDAEVQADGDKMRIILIKAKMMCYSKTVTACFKFKNSSS